MKILIIGGGNMGKTYAESFISNRAVLRKDLYILEKADDKKPYFQSLGFESVYGEAGKYISEMDLVVLAVKPQDTKDLFSRIRPFIKPEQVILSIMAGVTVQTLKSALSTSKIIRAMPNLPAQVGMGMTGFTADPSVTRSELFSVQNLLNTTGKSLYFDDEDLLNGVTAVSGSGPAYVYYFMQAMIDTAVQMGFSPTEAEILVQQTFLGAVHLLGNNSFTCKEWIEKVASKGGTTEAALDTFQALKVEDAISKGLTSALNRSRDLGT